MLAVRNTDPFGLMNREFDRVLRNFWGAEVPATLAPYAVDVHEDADHIYVEAELPGFSKEEVDVMLEDGVLTLRAERKIEEKGKGERSALHVERRWTQFQRSFTLPTAVNEAAVQAELADGVLKITLDKREEVKPRKIQVTVGQGNGKRIEADKSAT